MRGMDSLTNVGRKTADSLQGVDSLPVEDGWSKLEDLQWRDNPPVGGGWSKLEEMRQKMFLQDEPHKDLKQIEAEVDKLLATLDQAIDGASERTSLSAEATQKTTWDDVAAMADKMKSQGDGSAEQGENYHESKFIEKINECHSYGEIKQTVDRIVEKLSSESKDVKELGARLGLFGKSAFSVTHYGDFITPKTTIGGSSLGDVSYHIYDNDYLYDFAMGIKRQNLPNDANLLQQIMPMLDYYFGFPKDNVDRRSQVLDEWMEQNADAFYDEHPEMRQSEWFDSGEEQMSVSRETPISAFKKQGVAQCSERAVMAQNLLKMCGYDSQVVFGSCKSRGVAEEHAYNLVSIDGKNSLLDFSNTVYDYKDGKMVGRRPYSVALSDEDKRVFLSGDKVIEATDFHFENGKRVNENRMRRYGVGDTEV